MLAVVYIEKCNVRYNGVLCNMIITFDLQIYRILLVLITGVCRLLLEHIHKNNTGKGYEVCN